MDKGHQKLREAALQRYYANPQRCKNCGEVIKVKSWEAPALARRKIFCSLHCSNSYNIVQRVKDGNIVRKPDSGICEDCGIEIKFKKYDCGVISHRRFCDVCLKKFFVRNARETAEKRGVAFPKPVSEMTKQELRQVCKNGYHHFKSHINKHARQVYEKTGKPRVCAKCGYSVHVEVCHKKSISSFKATALISEINDPTNLFVLCRNHHKEFDDGLLDISGF